MNRFLNGYFYSPTKGNLKLNHVVREISDYIQEKPDKFYDIVVGCDSSSGLEPYFPAVIVVLRKGEGGRFCLKKISYSDRKFYNWKERILEEVMLSCQLASYLKKNFADQMDNQNDPNYQLRYIHADVGENGATRSMVREVTGLIRGNGFEPRIKPESYAASVIADRYT